MENKIIELLMQQIADLKAENADLRMIIKEFASKETNVVVNSYNGSSAHAEGGNGGTHNQTSNNVEQAHNIQNGNGTVNEL